MVLCSGQRSLLESKNTWKPFLSELWGLNVEARGLANTNATQLQSTKENQSLIVPDNRCGRNNVENEHQEFCTHAKIGWFQADLCTQKGQAAEMKGTVSDCKLICVLIILETEVNVSHGELQWFC